MTQRSTVWTQWLRHRLPAPRQLLMYAAGCVLFSIGAKFFIDARLGTDPLDVLVIGMNHYLQLGMGGCSAIVAVVLLTWWVLWNRRFPPLMPFVTTAAVGYLIDLWNWLRIERYTAIPDAPLVQVVLGLILCAYASSLIIMSGVGIRIMDLVAITMMEKLGYSFFRAKMTLEISLFATGWLLGGPVGVATVMFLFLVGPLIQPFIALNSSVMRWKNFGFERATSQG
ncbi:YczE/YyaS/YitT family protein [Roseateles amylovorans]|uniref:YitT family protein n=1 Tax=Roseateles amylovorans TaxID=2978473 RepID=A0ABY6AU45_9BURK|nr:hypothetical protein [Roseateles amylovorans]UXH76095.1 hypothetical protein N4261_13525 [Roseateles amylovorans]